VGGSARRSGTRDSCRFGGPFYSADRPRFTGAAGLLCHSQSFFLWTVEIFKYKSSSNYLTEVCALLFTARRLRLYSRCVTQY
jgi:hypothetical protein